MEKLKGKKEISLRKNFREAARTLEEKRVIGVSGGVLWNKVEGEYEGCCRLDLDFDAAYLSDEQVRELITVLREYLSAKEEK